MINHQRRQNDLYYLEKDAYLLCLHVRPTSIFCGFIILIMSFMNIIILLSKFTVEITVEFNLDKDQSVNHLNLDPRFRTNKLIILYIIAESLKLLISALLIYGVTRAKPSYLIPFFLMQLFYFFRSVSFFLESYSNYQHSIYRANNGLNNSNNELLDVQKKDLPQSYPMLIFFFSLLYKLYFIACVFKCYKYLKIKETIQVSNQIQFRQHQPNQVNASISVLHQTLPPSYQDVITITKDDSDFIDQTAPPAYEEAVKIQVNDLTKNEETTATTNSNTSITVDNTPANSNKSNNTQV